jgi:hypothetical protein
MAPMIAVRREIHRWWQVKSLCAPALSLIGRYCRGGGSVELFERWPARRADAAASQLQ